MKIGINFAPFNSIQGIEIFSKNIVSSLSKMKNQEDELIIFSSNDTPDFLFFPEIKTIKMKSFRNKYLKNVYQQFFLPFLLKSYKVDILFSPSSVAPFFYLKKVVVIHDCAYDRFNEFENIFSKFHFKLMFYGAKYFSKNIITISNFSKEELIKLYRIKPEKINVIYNGVPYLPKVTQEFNKSVVQKFKIDSPYFIYVGNTRPRKNLIGLLKSFSIFLEKFPNYKMVLSGKIDNRFIDIDKEIKKNKLEGSIIMTGFISEEEKVALYCNSSALVFPSYYEGFGLPILEAQSLGVPVLTSNTSSLPEVGGNGALYVDPYDIEDIAKGMERIAFDKDCRDKLITNGYQNIKRFSWDITARKTLELIKSSLK